MTRPWRYTATLGLVLGSRPAMRDITLAQRLVRRPARRLSDLMRRRFRRTMGSRVGSQLRF